MNPIDPDEWYRRRNSRSLRYAGRAMDPQQWVAISGDRDYLRTFAGQVAAITAANVLSRMTPSIAADLPDTPLDERLQWLGRTLLSAVMAMMIANDPHGRFKARGAEANDRRLHIGPTGADFVSYGAGWASYIGPAPAPAWGQDDGNPVGPALASVLAASRLYLDQWQNVPPSIVDLWNWTSDAGLSGLDPSGQVLGDIWFVGAGSVGSAIAYFLRLATNQFSASVFDMDEVRVHNLDRSPVFQAKDEDLSKAEVVARFLRDSGVSRVQPVPRALDEAAEWAMRQPGTPDIVISAANERNVRSVIEGLYPPLQIYGTTGYNWQAAMLRHAPLHEACSLCEFPETESRPMACATDVERRGAEGEKMDAALPFLSFAAGIMGAAEVLKTAVRGEVSGPNKAILYFNPDIRIISLGIPHRPGCLCSSRDPRMHAAALAGSQYVAPG